MKRPAFGTLLDARSLKVRLMVLAALSIGLVLAASGVLLTYLFEQHIQRRVAAELEVRWNEIAGALTLDAADRVTLSREPADPLYRQPGSGTYWQIDAPGQPPLRSRSLWDEALALPADMGMEAGAEAVAVEGPEAGSALYALVRPVRLIGAGGPVPARLAVAVDRREIAALSEDYAADLMRGLLVIAAVLLVVALLQALLGLAPLTALRRSVAAIRAGTRARMGGGFVTEIQPLADDLDRLLDWRDQAVERARDRAGALAHGFKTPLTILSLEARKLDAAGESAHAAVLRDQVEAMRRVVERELARARIRGGQGGTALGGGPATALAPLVAGLVATIRRLPHADAIAFEVAVPPGLGVRADRNDLGEVIGNLLDNARKFADGTVRVTAVAVDGAVTVSVEDDGPGFGAPAGDGRNDDGSGLGLAIVEDVLAAYGASLSRERRDGFTRLAFTLPAAPAG